MDPHSFTVIQLKNILQRYGLATSGRKTELVLRMQQRDPTGAWIEEAARAARQADVDEDEDDAQADDVDAQEQERAQSSSEMQSLSGNDWRQREAALTVREKALMQKEIEFLRRENEMLRSSPRSISSTVSKTTMSIKNISELLSEYHGSSDDFERWKAQVYLLKNTYELDENSAKILVGSRLKGKAQEWYYSLADNSILLVDELLEKMDAMFNQPLGRLERRRQFEARKWKKTETFSEYCHDKLILGNRVPIAEDKMVDYIIEGIPSEDLRNQAQMHSFETVPALLRGFRKIKLTMPEAATSRREYVGTLSQYIKPKLGVPKTDKESPSKSGVSTRGSSKCYNYQEVGHLAKNCTAKKEDHIDSKETTPKGRTTERQVGLIVDDGKESAEEETNLDDESVSHEEIHLVDLQSGLRDEFKKDVDLSVKGGNNISCIARIDTGCPITLSFADLALRLYVRKCQIYYGISFMSFNVYHELLHVVKDVKILGPLESYSAFAYENNMRIFTIFRRYCRKSHLPLQQIAHRKAEESNCHDRNLNRKSLRDHQTNKLLAVCKKHNTDPILKEISSAQQYYRVTDTEIYIRSSISQSLLHVER